MKTHRALVALCVASLGIGAHSHAFLDHSDPKVGSTVQTTPAELRVWFTQELEPAFSMVEVTDTAGKRVDAGRAQVDPHDPLLLRVPLTHLGPGAYTAIWRVISIDTHVTEGRFMFRVGQ